MNSDMEILARSMEEVPPLSPEVAARLRQRLVSLTEAEPQRSQRRRPRNHRRTIVRALAAAAAVSVTVAVGAAVLVQDDPTSESPPDADSSASVASAPTAQPDLSLVSFRQDGDYVVAEITDPTAAKRELDAVFQAHGFDISVNVVPASPSLVGTIVYASYGPDQPPEALQIEAIQTGPCVTGSGGSCTVGLRIPVGYSGRADVTVGRPAQPGEMYASAANAFGPGEALHCAPLLNQPVADAEGVLAERDVAAIWREGYSDEGTNEAPASGYVTNVIPISSTEVMIFVSPEPEAEHSLVNEADAGC